MGVRDDAKSCQWCLACLASKRAVGIGESEKSIAAPCPRRRAVHPRLPIVRNVGCIDVPNLLATEIDDLAVGQPALIEREPARRRLRDAR